MGLLGPSICAGNQMPPSLSAPLSGTMCFCQTYLNIRWPPFLQSCFRFTKINRKRNTQQLQIIELGDRTMCLQKLNPAHRKPNAIATAILVGVRFWGETRSNSSFKCAESSIFGRWDQIGIVKKMAIYQTLPLGSKSSFFSKNGQKVKVERFHFYLKNRKIKR